MINSGVLPQLATQKRKSADIALLAFPFDQLLDREDTEPILVQFEVDAQTVPVSIVVTGELEGGAQTETVSLPYPGSAIRRSTKKWTRVTEFASSDAETGNLRIRAVYDSGELAASLVLVDTIRGRLVERTRPPLLQPNQGLVAAYETMFLTNATLRTDDLLEIDGTGYRVELPRRLYDSVGPHHTEASVKRMGAILGGPSFVPIIAVNTVEPTGTGKPLSGSRPGRIFAFGSPPPVGHDAVYLNGWRLQRVASGPLGNQYTISGASITTGFDVQTDDILWGDVV